MNIFDSFAVEHNGVVQCSCGLSYVPTDAEDNQNHSAYHAHYERITKARGHIPWPYAVRERMKDEGRNRLRGAVTDAEALKGAELLARAWFDRSFMHAIDRGFGDEHPSLAEYTRMLAEDGLLDERARRVIHMAYKHVPWPVGVLTSTIWDPGPSWRRVDASTADNAN